MPSPETNAAWVALGQRVFAPPRVDEIEIGAASSATVTAAVAAAADDDDDTIVTALPRAPASESSPTHFLVSDPARTQRAPNAVRFVCISDTHNKHDALKLPDGDVLLHAGDFSGVGSPKEVAAFAQWFAGQDKFAHKIVIAGNHDLTFDVTGYAERAPRFRHPKGIDCQAVRESLIRAPGVTYLEESGCVVRGVTVWGSPWQPEFCDWAFNETRGVHMREKWARIPDRVDVLVTHGPPIGHGDRCQSGQLAGCVDLLLTVQQRVRPKLHVFGHIHEGYGVTSDGHTSYVNACTCTFAYKPLNAPIVFDVFPSEE